MRIFAFNPDDYRSAFAEQGFVHVKGGMDPEFLDELRAFARRSLDATKLDQFAIKGKKEQSLYEFPESTRFPDEIFDVVSTVCGLNRSTMTLSERHIQAYEANADPEPSPHKDRFPSQISIGFSIDIPAQSTLVLYPYDCREVNPFNRAATLIQSLQPSELPEVVLRDAREVEFDDEAGDVVMFEGSTTWHLRRNAARAVNLYVKVNDFDCDPLGEDPSTERRRQRTLEIMSNGGGTIGRHPAVVGRRLDYTSRQRSPRGSHETLHAALFGCQPFGLTPAQVALLEAADARLALDELVEQVSRDGGWGAATVKRDALTLLERGALDLLG